MHMIMNQEDKIRTPTFQFQTLFTYLISRNKAVLALKAAFVFFVLTLWCLMVDFSGFSISFPSFNLGRTHMFLICNGIVLILLKGSVFAAPNEDDGAADHQHVKKNHVQKDGMRCEVIEEIHVKRDDVVLGIQEEDQTISNGCILIAETHQTDQQFVQVDYEDEDEEDGFDSFEEDEELSVQELNQKCDEFIKKMRQVICDRR